MHKHHFNDYEVQFTALLDQISKFHQEAGRSLANWLFVASVAALGIPIQFYGMRFGALAISFIFLLLEITETVSDYRSKGTFSAQLRNLKLAAAHELQPETPELDKRFDKWDGLFDEALGRRSRSGWLLAGRYFLSALFFGFAVWSSYAEHKEAIDHRQPVAGATTG